MLELLIIDIIIVIIYGIAATIVNGIVYLYP
nr:MAG TPA: hypothetical protein [Crassvirales sp.]